MNIQLIKSAYTLILLFSACVNYPMETNQNEDPDIFINGVNVNVNMQNNNSRRYNIPMAALKNKWKVNNDSTSSLADFAEIIQLDFTEIQKFLPSATITFLRGYEGSTNLLKVIISIRSDSLQSAYINKTYTFDLTTINENINYILTLVKDPIKTELDFDKSKFELEKQSNKEKIFSLEEQLQQEVDALQKKQIKDMQEQKKKLAEKQRFLKIFENDPKMSMLLQLASLKRK
jgi:hypothetical protein